MVRHWRDRVEAGKELGRALLQYRGQPVVVLAIPRGGAPLGLEVARALDAPLELSIPRKIGHPWNKEYPLAVISELGQLVSREMRGIDQDWLEFAKQRELKEARRFRKLYCQEADFPSLQGKLAIIIDDFMVTGMSMQASVLDARRQWADKVIVAVPSAPEEHLRSLSKMADRVVSLDPGIGSCGGTVHDFYDDLPSLNDAEFGTIMHSARSLTHSLPPQ